MEHISKKDFFDVFDVDNMKERNKKMYNRIYNRVIKEWDTPKIWFESDNKKIYIESRISDCYWVAWSMLKKVSLPSSFIQQIILNNSKDILKRTLIDYQKIESTLETMKKRFSDKYVEVTYSIVLRTCLFLGINDFSDFKVSNILEAYEAGLLQNDGHRSRISSLLYYAGYTDKYYNDNNIYGHLKEQKMKANEYWSEEMKMHIALFIEDLKMSIISSYKMEVEKFRGLNHFSKWYCKNKDIINDLVDFDRNQWLEYIEYIKDTQKISNKTKEANLRAVKEFVEWSIIKEKRIIDSDKIIFRTDDLKSLKINHQNKSLAFEKRIHGERILNYLLNEFKSDDIRCLLKKEAIIIAANSGARISEIRMLEFGSCFYSEDEGLYKTIIDYPDKLNRKGIPLYLTKDGYQAFKRAEELKINYDFLKETYNKKLGRKYIPLFEYKGRSAISKTSLYKFIEDIKLKMKLVDEFGFPVKGGLHSFRHFFGKTMFIESDYNIEVVRYLLRHKSYEMSYRYIQEEKEMLLNVLQENEDNNKRFSGAGLDTIIDIIMNKHDSENKTIKKVLENSKSMFEMIENKKIKKVAFGYCLDPCKNANRCIKCKNYVLTSQEQDEIINATNELFEIICFKKSFLKLDEDSTSNYSLQNDIADLMIMIEEIKNLELDYKNLADDLKVVIHNV